MPRGENVQKGRQGFQTTEKKPARVPTSAPQNTNVNMNSSMLALGDSLHKSLSVADSFLDQFRPRKRYTEMTNEELSTAVRNLNARERELREEIDAAFDPTDQLRREQLLDMYEPVRRDYENARDVFYGRRLSGGNPTEEALKILNDPNEDSVYARTAAAQQLGKYLKDRNFDRELGLKSERYETAGEQKRYTTLQVALWPELRSESGADTVARRVEYTIDEWSRSSDYPEVVNLQANAETTDYRVEWNRTTGQASVFARGVDKAGFTGTLAGALQHAALRSPE